MKLTVCQIDSRAHCINAELSALAAHIKNEGSGFLLLPEIGLSDWLAADPVPDDVCWAGAVADHDGRIESPANFGTRAVMGTRPIVKENGSRRNQALIWTAKNGVSSVHKIYFLPDQEGY